jgi:hypothetical protein
MRTYGCAVNFTQETRGSTLIQRKTVPVRARRPALERQLAASQPAPSAGQAMRRARLGSLVRVQAITRPAGAPAPTPDVVYLRVYATRVTPISAGRQVASDGITVQPPRSGGWWLVSAVLFY